MQALFNRGIASALESAAVAKLEERLERLEQMRLVDKDNGFNVLLFVYKGDRLLALGALHETVIWVYELNEESSLGDDEHRLRLADGDWPVLSCVTFDESMIDECRGQTHIQFGRRGLASLLSPADFSIFLRGFLRVVQARCADAVRQNNVDAVRQLAEALDVEL
jgi:hypothetical protein